MMRACVLIIAVSLLRLAAGGLRADQIDMQNGDRYLGRVLVVGSNAVTFQSEVLGKVTLPRAKVSAIKIGTAASAAQPAPSAPLRLQTSPAPANAALLGRLPALDAGTNSIGQLREQLLGAAGPEAAAKFNEMLSGILSGSLTVDDIRAQAKSAAADARSLRKELGGDIGPVLDSYLAILDRFLAETEPGAAASAATNSAPSAPKAQARPAGQPLKK